FRSRFCAVGVHARCARSGAGPRRSAPRSFTLRPRVAHRLAWRNDLNVREPEGAAMGRRAQRVRSSWLRLAILAVLLLALTATPAAAKARSGVIVLPGATSAEGIASG